MRKLFGRVDTAEVLDPASEALVKALEAQKNLDNDCFEAGPTLGEENASGRFFFLSFFSFRACGMCWGLG